MTEQKIMLDMDGTWVDLYGVENWLNDLINENVRPYAEAKPLVNLSLLARTIHQLQRKGYQVGIITWLSKNGTKDYNERVAQTKMEWLAKHIPSVEWDEIHILPYGTPKSSCGYGILFDDELHNRQEWNGQSFDEKDLIKKMRTFL